MLPKVIKTGLVFGGIYGEGVLMRGTRVTAEFNLVLASWGWQVGAESYTCDSQRKNTAEKHSRKTASQNATVKRVFQPQSIPCGLAAKRRDSVRTTL